MVWQLDGGESSVILLINRRLGNAPFGTLLRFSDNSWHHHRIILSILIMNYKTQYLRRYNVVMLLHLIIQTMIYSVTLLIQHINVIKFSAYYLCRLGPKGKIWPVGNQLLRAESDAREITQHLSAIRTKIMFFTWTNLIRVVFITELLRTRIVHQRKLYLYCWVFVELIYLFN